MAVKELTWIGLSVDDYLIYSELSEDQFSWVFRGLHKDEPRAALFKVAKPLDVIQASIEDTSITQTLAIWSGSVQPVRPDCTKLFERQVQSLQVTNKTLDNQALIQVQDFHLEDGLCYIRLDDIEGVSLRQMISKGQIDINVMIDIAETLNLLTTEYNWHHGNLKPENIFVTDSGIRLIEPGYFGPLDCMEGADLGCAVTAPAYYPFLEPNDLFAFGLILFEIVTKSNPLAKPANDFTKRTLSASSEMLDWVESYESSGQSFISPILHLTRPSILLDNVPPEVESLLVAILGLEINDQGEFNKTNKSASFQDVIEELNQLKRSGLREV